MADFAPNPFALLGGEDGDHLSKFIIHRVTSEKAVSDHDNQTDFSQQKSVDDKNKAITLSDNSKKIHNKFEKKQKQKLKKEKLDDELCNYEKIAKSKSERVGEKKQHGGRRKHNLWTKHQNYWRLILVLSVLIIMDSLFTLTFNYFSSM